MTSPGSGGRPFTLTAGARLGAYEIMDSIGAGGMGEVYRARDTRLTREVAIKVIPAGSEKDRIARARIEREARIVASLNHPNILALHDIGTDGEAIFIVTELVDGLPLGGMAPPLSKCLDLAAQIADGLAAAHAAGITHRDLKPDNVMVTRDGRVKLLDFGVASQRPLCSDGEGTITVDETERLAGTIGYMAPEQLRSSEVDSRADIFSFGALLYELLTGTRAFQGDSAADVVTAVLQADPPELPPSIPSAVRAIVGRCLEKNREERFQSARDLGFALRQAAGTSATASQTGSAEPAGAPSPTAIRGHVEKLLSSPAFAGAARLSALLRFIVEETLGGRQGQLKELRIGLDVFGRRTDSYDPAFDPIVRVQMGRLRAKLRAYYNGPGLSARIRIDIPLGSYVPVFTTAVPAPPGEPQPAPALTASDDQRIAVLPIVNMSADPGNQYFCDGLTEELINHLAQVPRLRVVARTSSFQFKDLARDIREIGRLLDVTKVLEGSVRRSGNRIRVTVQLINVVDGCHVWSERYEGSLSDVFAIHEQISTAVQRSLQLHVLGAEATAPRTRARQIDAYDLYLQGRFHWKKRTDEGLRTALDHFERAARLDPGFARARAGIADCQFMLGMSAAEAPQLCMPRAADAAREALCLDVTLSEAHASLAGVRNCFDWDLRAAEEGYGRAIELDPSCATALHWRGLFLQATRGQSAEAVKSLDQAMELDPMSPPIVADVGLVYAFREDFDRADMYCRRALSLQTDFHRSYWFLGLIGAWSGNFQAAQEALEQGLQLCPGPAFRSRLLGALGFAYGRWGRSEQAARVKRDLERTRETSYVPSFELAQIEMGLGNHAGALACLEHAVVHRDSYAIFLRSWNTFAPLRHDPRFLALLAQIGLA